MFPVACRLLCLGRFLVGLGIGISAVVVPVYLGEVAPAQVNWQACYALAASPTQQQIWCLSVKTQLLPHMHAKLLTIQQLLSEAPGFFYELLLCGGMLGSLLADVALMHLPDNWRWMVGLPVLPATVLAGIHAQQACIGFKVTMSVNSWQ